MRKRKKYGGDPQFKENLNSTSHRSWGRTKFFISPITNQIPAAGGRGIHHSYGYSWKYHPEHPWEPLRGCQRHHPVAKNSVYAARCWSFQSRKHFWSWSSVVVPKLLFLNIPASPSTHHQCPKSLFQRATLGSAGEQSWGRQGLSTDIMKLIWCTKTIDSPVNQPSLYTRSSK